MAFHKLRARRGGALAAVVAAMLVLSGCAGKSDVQYTPVPQAEGDLPDDVRSQLETAVDDALVASGSTGAIVGVWVPWSGSWVAGIGTQNGDDAKPVTVDQPFRIGPITRLMTCDLLYAMADRGVVALDDPITKHLSGVPDLSAVTLVDLCNGTAGIGSSGAKLRPIWLENPQRVWNPREIAAYGLERKSTGRGTYADSDAGYQVLGEALERAGDATAAELLNQYVFGPLGLRHTQLPGTTPAAPSNALRGHYLPPTEDGKGLDCAAPVDITVSSSSIGFTDSGVVSTIEDLGRYMQAEAAQAFRLNKEPDRYANPLAPAKDAPSWYRATGGAYLAGSMIGQHGWAPGYLTAAYSDPATGFTVAVVLNNSSGGAGIVSSLAWELAAIASKTPAASGYTAPDFGLPFTAEQYSQKIQDAAICSTPAGDGA